MELVEKTQKKQKLYKKTKKKTINNNKIIKTNSEHKATGVKG